MRLSLKLFKFHLLMPCLPTNFTTVTHFSLILLRWTHTV